VRTSFVTTTGINLVVGLILPVGKDVNDEDEGVGYNDVTLDMFKNERRHFRKAVRKRFSIRMQMWALLCKNTALQRRSWGNNIAQCLIPIISVDFLPPPPTTLQSFRQPLLGNI